MKLTKTKAVIGSLLAFLTVAHAQLESPPALIDYQGRVLDATGGPIAPDNAENIEMYFRIWDHSSSKSAANLIWAEKQIVTVLQGNFSVRLGEGDAIQSSAGDNVLVSGQDDPRPALDRVFDGKERFIGLSVAANAVTKPKAEIRPRLRFLSTPYALNANRALTADSVGGALNDVGSSREPWGVRSVNWSLADFDGNGQGAKKALAFGPEEDVRFVFYENGHFGANSASVNGLDVTGGGLTATRITVRPRNDGSPNPLASFLRVDGKTELTGDLVHGGGTASLNDATLSGQSGVNATRPEVSFLARGAGTQRPFQVETADGGARIRVAEDGGILINPKAEARTRLTGTTHLSGEVGVNATSSSVSFLVRGSGGDTPFQVQSPDGSPSLSVLSNGEVSAHGNTTIQGNLKVQHPNAGATGWRIFDLPANRALVFMNPDNDVNDQIYFMPDGRLFGRGWSSISDRRLKENLEPFEGALEKVLQLEVKKYDWKNDPSRPRETGLIAQSVGGIFPQFVHERPDGYQGVDYSRLSVVAIAALQEMHSEVEASSQLQAEEMRALRKENESLKTRLDHLEKLVNSMK